jgi:hypothetical protein
LPSMDRCVRLVLNVPTAGATTDVVELSDEVVCAIAIPLISASAIVAAKR